MKCNNEYIKVGIIIVNYDRCKLLQNCLKSIVKSTYKNREIIVIDNGSVDKSVQMVQQEYSCVHLIKMNYNSGFCKANNVGIQYALEQGCNVICLINNDVEIEKYCIESAVNFFDIDKQIGMVAPKIMYMADKTKINATGQVITPDGIAKCRNEMDVANKCNMSNEVFCPYGAVAFYYSDMINELIVQDGSFLDEDYFMYYEELDVGWRARLLGWSCVYDPNAIAYHHGSATSGTYSKLIAFQTNRNAFYNIIKNYPSYFFCKAIFLSFLRYPILLIGILFKVGAAHKIKNNIPFSQLLIVVFHGYIDIILHIYPLFKKRYNIQRGRRASNKDVNRWFKELGISFFDSIYK